VRRSDTGRGSANRAHRSSATQPSRIGGVRVCSRLGARRMERKRTDGQQATGNERSALTAETALDQKHSRRTSRGREQS
jgi:hypothetical protein